MKSAQADIGISEIEEVRAKTNLGLSLEILHSEHAKLNALGKSGPLSKKLNAELSYLIARVNLEEGNFKDAYAAAEQAVQLYESLKVETYEDAAPILFKYVPDLMHEDVVRRNVLDRIPPVSRT